MNTWKINNKDIQGKTLILYRKIVILNVKKASDSHY